MEKEYSILLVEDERPLQNAIRAKLERENFNVLLATDVDQAIEYLKDEDVVVDGVWLDHYLFGKKNGLDFIVAAREYGITERIPIFVVTNTGGHEKKESYMQLGATDYYVKSDHRLDEIVGDIKNFFLNQK